MSNSNGTSVSVVIDQIVTGMVTAEERRLVTVCDTVIEDNDKSRGSTSGVISYKNEEHYHSGMAIRFNKKVPMNVAPHMTAKVDGFLAERDKIQSDKAQIKDLLRAMLGNTKHAQEIRDRIPDCLTQFAPGWVATLPRVNDLQHELRFDRQLWKRYLLLQSKVEMYAATHLIF